jgi:hypothetical protein
MRSTANRLLALALLLLSSLSLASPSAFFENAAFASLGPVGPSFKVGAEHLVPVPALDVAAGAEVVVSWDWWQGRLYASTLAFPALGTTPPLAVGAGADLGYGSGGFSGHLGPIVGTDLLFTLDLPMTASLYLAPGFAQATGLSLAWSAHLRYYFDDVAVELESSDLQLINLGLRVLF